MSILYTGTQDVFFLLYTSNLLIIPVCLLKFALIKTPHMLSQINSEASLLKTFANL